jgi:hypothetical protein
MVLATAVEKLPTWCLDFLDLAMLGFISSARKNCTARQFLAVSRDKRTSAAAHCPHVTDAGIVNDMMALRVGLVKHAPVRGRVDRAICALAE